MGGGFPKYGNVIRREEIVVELYWDNGQKL